MDTGGAHPEKLLIVPKCTVVALTAYVNQDNLEMCFKSGMSHVMHKPACSKEIQEVIEKKCPFLKPGNFKTLEPT